jgi:hypothetical protein
MIFTLEATYNTDGTPQSLSVHSENLASYADAETLAATFPKALRMRAVECSTAHGSVYYVRASASLSSTRTTGARNETSQRRVRGLFRALAAREATLVWATPYVNSYASREEFEAAAL